MEMWIVHNFNILYFKVYATIMSGLVGRCLTIGHCYALNGSNDSPTGKIVVIDRRFSDCTSTANHHCVDMTDTLFLYGALDFLVFF